MSRRPAGVAGEPPFLPFRPFFVLAALHSILGVGPWIPHLAAWGEPAAVAPVAGWHARELLFGAVPAVLTGFLLTALPRWTGRALEPARLWLWLLLLWLAGAAALVVAPALRPAIAAGYLVLLALVVGRHLARSGDRRNLAIPPLLALLGLAAGLDLVAWPDAAGAKLRLAVAAILGLVMVLGGRIVPAISAAYLDRRGRPGPPPPARWIERAAAAAAAAALAAWVASPGAGATGVLAVLAAAAQGARCLRWQPWRVAARPPVLALHAAYGCIPAGFMLLAAGALGTGSGAANRLGDAGLHVWSLGAIGLMCLTVMASMIRRHLGSPLAPSTALNAVLGLLACSLAARVVAAAGVARPEGWLLAAAAGWVAAHALFLALFARPLLLGRPARP